jgi:uncharacterized membrane protein HdeD (DUF308 family)
MVVIRGCKSCQNGFHQDQYFFGIISIAIGGVCTICLICHWIYILCSKNRKEYICIKLTNSKSDIVFFLVFTIIFLILGILGIVYGCDRCGVRDMQYIFFFGIISIIFSGLCFVYPIYHLIRLCVISA